VRNKLRRSVILQVLAILFVASAGLAVAATTPAGSAWKAQTALPCATLTGAIDAVALGSVPTTCTVAAPIQSVRLTVQARLYPPAFPGDPTTPTTTSAASGWLVWPSSGVVKGLVVYAHDCCAVPTTLAADAGGIAAATGSLVIAMDYRPEDQNPNNLNWYTPDFNSEDLAAAVTLVKAALPNISPTVAVGVGEGGAVTGLMIEHHSGLVDSWVDAAGSVDIDLEYTQLYADQAPNGTQNTSPAYASAILDLLNRTLGVPADPTAHANNSPIMHQRLLAGLKAAVIVHAVGDEVVPYSASAELAGDLQAAKVPTKFDSLIPLGDQTPLQPSISNAWHSASALPVQALTEVGALVGPTPTYPVGLQSVLIPSVASP
jgi:hypothetical protein